MGWFKREALTLKTEMEKQEERETEVKMYNLSLNEQNLALEQALLATKKKAKDLGDCLAKAESHKMELIEQIQKQELHIEKLEKNELER